MISSHKDGRTNWPQRIKEVSIRTINECLLYKNNYLLPLASTWCTTSLSVTCSPDMLVKVVVEARRSVVYTETLLLFTSHVRLWVNSKCQHIAQCYQRSRKTIQSNFGESILLAVTWPHVHPFMTECTAASQNEIRRKCLYVNVLVTGRKKCPPKWMNAMPWLLSDPQYAYILMIHYVSWITNLLFSDRMCNGTLSFET